MAVVGRKKGSKTRYQIIEINDKYRVCLDNLNLVLQEFDPTLVSDRTEDDGDTSGWKFMGYFLTWEGVFNKLLRKEIVKKIKKQKVKDIMELQTIFLNVKKNITVMAKDIKIKYDKTN